jgi:hypothetical protein
VQFLLHLRVGCSFIEATETVTWPWRGFERWTVMLSLLPARRARYRTEEIRCQRPVVLAQRDELPIRKPSARSWTRRHTRPRACERMRAEPTYAWPAFAATSVEETGEL